MMITIFLILINLTLTAPDNGRADVPAGEVLFDRDVLSWYSIDYWLNVYEVRETDIVKRQIRLETGDLTSRICRECNNLFGMKKARKRQTTAIGRERNGTAVYKDFKDSIRDYKLFQDYFYSGGDYYNFLRLLPYAVDPEYVNKLKRINCDS